MAVDPFDRIGRAERQEAGQHLIEGDAERIEVAARGDRAVHAPGLFRRHIGKRAGYDLRRLGRLTLARQTRGDAEPGDVLVDEAAPARLAQRRGDADGEAQEAPGLHRRADEPLERFAAWILAQQRCPTGSADRLVWPGRPCGVELILQLVLMGEAIEDGRRGMLRGGHHNQHRATAALAVRSLSPAQAQELGRDPRTGFGGRERPNGSETRAP